MRGLVLLVMVIRDGPRAERCCFEELVLWMGRKGKWN